MTAVSPTASGPPALDIITLGIAVAGLVVAVIGLTWQVALAIRGRNPGRLAVAVTGWDVLTRDGFGYTLPGFGPNPQVPHRLEPGAAVTFYCPLADVAALFATKRIVGKTDERVRGSLSLGTGEVVRSKLVPMS